MKQLFWLNDETWEKVEPLLPSGGRGAPRADDRRIISGILHMLHAGGRWRDWPANQYGPYATVCNRYARWRKQGIWPRIHDAVAPAIPTRAPKLAESARH